VTAGLNTCRTGENDHVALTVAPDLIASFPRTRAGGARLGSAWVHLRLCLTCGHVGCCDSSPLRHARGHAYGIGHPIVQSFEPGENWRWCYVDETYV
jgi:hypothetical protein